MWYTLGMNGFYESARDIEHRDIEVFESQGTKPHFHAQVEILCITHGNVEATINGETYELKEGDICVSGSYDVHAYTVENENIAICVIFPLDFLQRYLAAVKNRCVTRHILRDEKTYRDVCGLIKLYSEQKSRSGLFKAGWADTVLGLLIDKLELAPIAADGRVDTVREILSYISEHFEEELTLKGLSKKFGYSSHHFSRVFNAFTNISLKKYVNSLRLEAAASRLRAGESVTDAAFDSGFGSMRSFYRDFTEYYGETPQRYVRSNEAGNEKSRDKRRGL